MRLSEEIRDLSLAGLFLGTTAAEIVRELPADWTHAHLLTSGRAQQDPSAFLDALLERPEGAGAVGIDCITWAFTREDVARRWVERFPAAGAIRLVVDSFAHDRRTKARGETPWDRTIRALGGWESGRLRAGCCHAKLVRPRGTDLAILSSANIELRNYRIENVTLARSPSFARECDAWFDTVWRETEPRPDGRRTGDREVRAAHKLAVGVSRGQSAGGVIPGAAAGQSGDRPTPSPDAAASTSASGRTPSARELARIGREVIAAKLRGAEASEIPGLLLGIRRAEILGRTDQSKRERAAREREELALAKERGELVPAADVRNLSAHLWAFSMQAARRIGEQVRRSVEVEALDGETGAAVVERVEEAVAAAWATIKAEVRRMKGRAA